MSMRALVVYESMFGNTEAVAKAVADSLSEVLPAEVVEVGVAPTPLPDDVGLLVVGGPTHAFGMSRPATRKSAADQAEGALVSARVGIREWLRELDLPRKPQAATFDTRVKKRFLPGSAARGAARRLRRTGATLVLPPESFWVVGTPGPLQDGELDRARQWGARLAAAVRSAATAP